MARTALRSATTGALLRWGILLLAAIGIVGLGTELLFLRHWGEARSIVWLGMLAVALSLALLVFRPTRARVRAAQGLALAAFLVSVVGLGFHLSENLSAGPLDRDYADHWASMSQVEQLFAAATGDVGPAPTLAPGALAQVSFLLLLATLRHPALLPEQAAVRMGAAGTAEEPLSA